MARHGRQSQRFQKQSGAPGMARQVADPNDANARLCDGVIVFDRAAAHADGSDQNAFLVDN
jgi:hypothetical protein